MGRPSISEQRRIEIGRALQACMVKNGSYEATSVKDIAQQAGIATGLVHHYFASKEEILLLIADNSLLAVSNMLEDLLHTQTLAERGEKLHELLADESQNRFLLMLYALSLSMPEIRRLIAQKHEEMQEELSSRLRRSGKDAETAKQTAFEITFLLENAVTHAAVSDAEELETMLAAVLQKAFPIEAEKE